MTIPTRAEVETELVKTMCPSCDAGLLTECTCPDKNEVANRILKAFYEEFTRQENEGFQLGQRLDLLYDVMDAAGALYDKEQP